MVVGKFTMFAFCRKSLPPMFPSLIDVDTILGVHVSCTLPFLLILYEGTIGGGQ